MAPSLTDLLLLFPVALLAIGLMLLALVRRQIVDWQTLTGAVLFAEGLFGAVVWLREASDESDRVPFQVRHSRPCHGYWVLGCAVVRLPG